MNAVYGRYFPAPHPARATVQVTRLPAGPRVEIEAIRGATCLNGRRPRGGRVWGHRRGASGYAAIGAGVRTRVWRPSARISTLDLRSRLRARASPQPGPVPMRSAP